VDLERKRRILREMLIRGGTAVPLIQGRFESKKRKERPISTTRGGSGQSSLERGAGKVKPGKPQVAKRGKGEKRKGGLFARRNCFYQEQERHILRGRNRAGKSLKTNGKRGRLEIAPLKGVRLQKSKGGESQSQGSFIR